MSKGIPRWLLVSMASLVALSGCIDARSITCRQGIDCKRICDDRNPAYRPQDCTNCCEGKIARFPLLGKKKSFSFLPYKKRDFGGSLHPSISCQIMLKEG